MGTLDRIKSAASRITLPINLGDFEKAYDGAVFEVCVTPSRAHLRSWAGITEFIQEATANSKDMSEEAREEVLEEYRERQLSWLAVTWVNITIDDARGIRDHLEEDNPLAWDWIVMRTSATIGNFRQDTLKN